MKKLGVGIVGAGWVSGEHIKAFIKNPHTEVRGICSRKESSARAKMEENNIKCRIYTDYEKMLEERDIDIISICTPNHLHTEEVIQAAGKGKNIVIEKPVALCWEDLLSMRKAIRKNKVKTITSFVLRWNPLFKTIKSLLEDDAIGEIFYAEVDYFHGIGPWYKQYTWNVKKDMGGSSLLSAGCHALDGLLWFVQKEVVEVTAYSTHSRGKDFRKYEYNPTQVTFLKFKNGTLGKVASCLECKMPYLFNILLVGTKGTIRNNQLYSHKLSGQTSWATIPTILPDSGDVTHHPFQGEIDHFIDCIITDRENEADFENVFKTHEIIFAADCSAKKARPVKLPHFGKKKQ